MNITQILPNRNKLEEIRYISYQCYSSIVTYAALYLVCVGAASWLLYIFKANDVLPEWILFVIMVFFGICVVYSGGYFITFTVRQVSAVLSMSRGAEIFAYSKIIGDVCGEYRITKFLDGKNQVTISKDIVGRSKGFGVVTVVDRDGCTVYSSLLEYIDEAGKDIVDDCVVELRKGKAYFV